MEHLLLLTTTIGPELFAIGSALLDDNIITEDNQSSASIYRRGHGDMYSPFGSRKSGNKMIIDRESTPIFWKF